MKTEKTTVTGTIYVFAKAKSDYVLENLEPGELPFTYEIKSYDYGDESCVRLHEQQISITVPDGIDITMECVKNLNERIEAVEEKAKRDVADLQARIKAIALIEYKPDAAA